jgi:hypothetical protein
MEKWKKKNCNDKLFLACSKHFNLNIFFPSKTDQSYRQGDQIVVFFTSGRILTTEEFLDNFLLYNLCINFCKKMVGQHFGRFFHKLVWSHCIPYACDPNVCMYLMKTVFVPDSDCLRARVPERLPRLLHLQEHVLCWLQGRTNRFVRWGFWWDFYIHLQYKNYLLHRLSVKWNRTYLPMHTLRYKIRSDRRSFLINGPKCSSTPF